jgi:hypothetical protein
MAGWHGTATRLSAVEQVAVPRLSSRGCQFRTVKID